MQKWLYLLLVLSAGCGKTISDECANTALYSHSEYPIGTAFNYFDYISTPRLASTFDQHFNSLTPENALKYASIKPVLNAPYDFSETDSLISLAKRQNARVHGHTLVWHQQLPGWFLSYQGDYSTLLKSHVREVVYRYRNEIYSWDVVNEALNETGGLRASPWREKVGDDYIYQAFLEAQSANASAILFYNDFNLALNPRKLDAAIRLCENLRERGVKNVGIGMQMHVGASFPTKREMAEAVAKIWRAGFQVHFSEVDVSLNPTSNKTSFSENDFQAQAKKYRDIAEVYAQIPAEYQFGITFWGIGDADSWIPSFFNRADAPLLFDKNYQPKPAFCGFQSGL